MRIGCMEDRKFPTFSHDSKDNRKQPVEEWSQRYKRDLYTRVGITEEQFAKIEPLIKQAQVDFRRLREQSFQKVSEVAQKFDQTVSALLTEEQKPKYQQLIIERLERIKKMDRDRMRPPKGDAPPDRPPPPPPNGGDVPPPPPGPETDQPKPARGTPS